MEILHASLKCQRNQEMTLKDGELSKTLSAFIAIPWDMYTGKLNPSSKRIEFALSTYYFFITCTILWCLLCNAEVIREKWLRTTHLQLVDPQKISLDYQLRIECLKIWRKIMLDIPTSIRCEETSRFLKCIFLGGLETRTLESTSRWERSTELSHLSQALLMINTMRNLWRKQQTFTNRESSLSTMGTFIMLNSLRIKNNDIDLLIVIILRILRKIFCILECYYYIVYGIILFDFIFVWFLKV